MELLAGIGEMDTITMYTDFPRTDEGLLPYADFYLREPYLPESVAVVNAKPLQTMKNEDGMFYSFFRVYTVNGKEPPKTESMLVRESSEVLSGVWYYFMTDEKAAADFGYRPDLVETDAYITFDLVENEDQYVEYEDYVDHVLEDWEEALPLEEQRDCVVEVGPPIDHFSDGREYVGATLYPVLSVNGVPFPVNRPYLISVASLKISEPNYEHYFFAEEWELPAFRF